MTALTHLFSALLSMSLTALPVIAVVLAVRLLLRRAPRKYSYALWTVVGFRLLCPVSIPQPWSLFNLRPMRAAAEAVGTLSGGFSAVGSAVVPAVPRVAPAPLPSGGAAVEQITRSGGNFALRLGALLWLLGLALLLGYGVWAYFRLRRTVATAVLRETNIYECDAVSSPFVLGFFRPKIYIPFHLDDNRRTFVLCHERIHIRRRDYLVKPLAYLLLALYWWNPAVWLCYILCCRDMEMSCDEAVLNALGKQAKAGYGMALVDFATERRFPAASPLAFGELDAKNRVRHVLKWKKDSAPVTFLALCAVALVAMVCGSNATADSESWVQLKGGGMDAGITVHLAESVQSWALYEDIYEEGRLISSRPVLLAGFATDAPLSRKFSGTLRVAVTTADDTAGFSGNVHCSYQDENGTQSSWTIQLPKDFYTASGAVLGPERETHDAIQRCPLSEQGDVLVLTEIFSTKPDGGTVMYHQDLGVVGANDTVVQFRLVTSQQTAENFPAAAANSPADRLYALRTPYIGDAPAVGELLQALNVGRLGDYTIELFTSKSPLTLQVNFKDIPADIDPTSPGIDSAMWNNALLLLALVDNLEQVNWSYPSREDGEEFLYTIYENGEQADVWIQNLGYDSVKDAGKTPAGFQALWEYLPAGQAKESTLQYLPTAGGAPARSYAYTLDESVGSYGIQELIYQRGTLVSNQWQAGGAAEKLPRQGQFTLQYAPRAASGGWDQIDWKFAPENAPAQAFTTKLPREQYTDGRRETALGEYDWEWPVSLKNSDATTLFAAFYGAGGGVYPLPCEDLNDPARLAACAGDNDVLVVLRLVLSPEGKVPPNPAAPQLPDEAAWWQAYLNAVDNNGFLCSAYAKPRDADLAEIFYNGAGLPDGTNVPEELRTAYEQAIGGTVETDMSRVDSPAGNAFLRAKCGTGLQDHAKGLQNWTYLPEVDVYLFQHGDTNWRGITVVDVTQTEDSAAVLYRRDEEMT
ncbi:MAG: M56 family metallopeptidase, partial [Oscillibacter sp.]